MSSRHKQVAEIVLKKHGASGHVYTDVLNGHKRVLIEEFRGDVRVKDKVASDIKSILKDVQVFIW